MFRRIDIYIIRKFLTTFFVAIGLIISLTIVFDVSERLDGFMGRMGAKPTLNEILFDYYGNFIPYFANLFSPLFVFISVIFFTSRMASRLEIVSILATGISFWRMLVPFIFSAVLIAIASFSLTNYVIPNANATRLAFEKKYFSKSLVSTSNFHQQLEPGVMVYVERFDYNANLGYKFSYEKMENGRLVYKLMSQTINWDSTRHSWMINDYIIREIRGEKEFLKIGSALDTTWNFDPTYFKQDLKGIVTMSNAELNRFIEQEKGKGSKYVDYYLIEKHNRTANPISTIILTLIAVPIASRKMRGGIGMHLALGVALAFSYIFMMRITTTFATKGSWSPFMAVWLPNFLYIGIGVILTKFAQK